MDVGTEELSHLEVVGTLARMHLKRLKSIRDEAEADRLADLAHLAPQGSVPNCTCRGWFQSQSRPLLPKSEILPAIFFVAREHSCGRYSW